MCFSLFIFLFHFSSFSRDDLRSSDYPAFCFTLAMERNDAVGELSDLTPLLLRLVAKPLMLVFVG